MREVFEEADVEENEGERDAGGGQWGFVCGLGEI